MNKILGIVFFLTASLSATSASIGDSYASPKKIIINNRPLLKINKKTISLMDVVKKMDVIIHENYPEVAENLMARFQFYTHQWKYFLEDIWMAELMKADAEEKDIKVTEGDIREEVENRFGPNVVTTLDRLGLSYEEARDMVHSELIVQKMSWFKIYSPSFQSIAPKDVKVAYDDYLDKNPPKDEWQYQMLTLQGDDKDLNEKLAKEACALLRKHLPEQKTTIDVAANQESPVDMINMVSQQLTKKYPKAKIVASKDYNVESTALAPEQKQILADLNVGQYSAPVKQFSRAAGGEVWRIFHLKKHSQTLPEKFQDLAQNLQDDLVNVASQKNRQAYKKKLQEKFGLSDEDLKKEIPDDYIPFSMIDSAT